jgi:hypothetical protein
MKKFFAIIFIICAVSNITGVRASESKFEIPCIKEMANYGSELFLEYDSQANITVKLDDQTGENSLLQGATMSWKAEEELYNGVSITVTIVARTDSCEVL